MRVVREKRIQGELLEVDGKHFIDCVLIDCVLQYGGGHVVMERTRVSGCQHVFFGSARLTVNYLEAMELIPPSELGGESGEIIH